MTPNRSLLDSIERYRRLAGEALDQARQQSDPKYRDAYLRTAADWTAVAREAERYGEAVGFLRNHQAAA